MWPSNMAEQGAGIEWLGAKGKKLSGAWAPGMSYVLCGNSLKRTKVGGNGDVLIENSGSPRGRRSECSQKLTCQAYAQRKEPSLGHGTTSHLNQ